MGGSVDSEVNLGVDFRVCNPTATVLGLLLTIGATACGSSVSAPEAQPLKTQPPKAEPIVAAAGWNPPVLMSEPAKAYIEASLALDPTDSRRAFSCTPAAIEAAYDSQSWFYSTSDGGETWGYQKVEGGLQDIRGLIIEGQDCDVAYDQAGTMYVADNWIGSVSVGNSRDAGKTWTGTPLAASVPVADRPWLVAGKPGHVFMSYQDVQCCLPSLMWFTKSSDYGKTFSPAVSVTSAADGPGAFTWQGNFVVSPSEQDIYLVYTRRQGLNHIPEGPETIWVAHSRDGGATWESSLVATLPQQKTTIYPSIAMDAGGVLHVVWSAPGESSNPIYYSFSRNGQLWHEPVALNPGKVGWAPWVAGGAAGRAAIAWLGSPDPTATALTENPWFFGWAKVELVGDEPRITTGDTTTTPVFVGQQGKPEFNTVRLDRNGKMHLAMAVYQVQEGGSSSWVVYSQTER